MDGHLHFTDGGFQLASVDLRPANTPEEFIARLKAFAAERQPGEWILGGELGPRALARRPASPARVDRLGHAQQSGVRVPARRAHGAGQQRRAPRGQDLAAPPGTSPAASSCAIRARASRPASSRTWRWVRWSARCPRPPTQQRDAALRRALAYAASKGVTAFAHVSVEPADLGTYLRAKAAGALTARAALYFPLEDWRAVADTIAAHRPRRRLGVDRRRQRLHGRLARLDHRAVLRALRRRPHDVGPAESPPKIRCAPGSARRTRPGSRWRSTPSASAPTASLLDIYDSVARAHGPRDRRFRIEHAQHLRRQDIDRLARSGVIASMQPYHAHRRRPLGREADRPRADQDDVRVPLAARPKGASRLRLRLDRGADRSAARHLRRGHPADARRQAPGRLGAGAEDHGGGGAPGLHQRGRLRRVRRADAAAGLRPGYKADLVLLDQDLTRIPPEAIERAAVRATVVGGRVVYEAK